MGKKASNTLGITDISRTYCVEQYPLAVEPDRDGKYRVWVKGFSWGSGRPNEMVPVKLLGAGGFLGFEQGEP